MRDNNWRVRTRKPLKNGPSIDSDLLRKFLNIFDLAAPNTIFMKLTLILYFHKVFHLAQEIAQKP